MNFARRIGTYDTYMTTLIVSCKNHGRLQMCNSSYVHLFIRTNYQNLNHPSQRSLRLMSKRIEDVYEAFKNQRYWQLVFTNHVSFRCNWVDYPPAISSGNKKTKTSSFSYDKKAKWNDSTASSLCTVTIKSLETNNYFF